MTASFEGFWDSSEPAWLQAMLGIGSPPRDIEIAPKGYGRPWYPLYVGRAIIESSYERVAEEDGSPNLIVSMDTRYVEGPTKQRVGIRRWLRMARKKRREMREERELQGCRGEF